MELKEFAEKVKEEIRKKADDNEYIHGFDCWKIIDKILKDVNAKGGEQ